MTLRKYSVQAKGFDGQNLDTEEMKKFFSKFGDVKQVSFAYKYNDSMVNLIKIVKCKKKLLKIKSKQRKKSEKKEKYEKQVK